MKVLSIDSNIAGIQNLVTVAKPVASLGWRMVSFSSNALTVGQAFTQVLGAYVWQGLNATAPELASSGLVMAGCTLMVYRDVRRAWEEYTNEEGSWKVIAGCGIRAAACSYIGIREGLLVAMRLGGESVVSQEPHVASSTNDICPAQTKNISDSGFCSLPPALHVAQASNVSTFVLNRNPFRCPSFP